MAYEQQTLRILTEAGRQGISLRNLALNVYNLSVSVFDAPDFEAVYRQVQGYVRRNSLTPSSLVEHMGERGHYRLNLGRSPLARQLMLEFGQEEKPGEPAAPAETSQAPSLFGDEWD